ncbi:MAG: hypothetical protein M0Q38_07365 [Bacteroidales bacterium]|nr:hypothetical protein [Bacteroidales bacterium]
MQDTGCRILDARCWILDDGYWITNGCQKGLTLSCILYPVSCILYRFIP